MPWYVVVKTIKGHRYRYQQRTWREGQHVRCECIYLGRADGPLPKGRGSAGGIVMPSLTGDVAVGSPKTETGTASALPVTAFGPLLLTGEDNFIADLLDDKASKGVRWQSGYRWTSRKKTGVVLSDPEVLRLPLRLGVTVRSQIRKGKHGFPCFMDRGLRMWSTHENGSRTSASSRYGAAIELPDPSKWVGTPGISPERSYVGTLLHETVHATRAQLGRPNSHWEPLHSVRTRLYAREEVVAELSANIIARRLGLERESNEMSRAYIVGWKNRLPAEAKVEDVAWAIEEAKRAADFVLMHHSRGGFGVNTTLERTVSLARPKVSGEENDLWQPPSAVANIKGQDIVEATVDQLRLFHGRSPADVLQARDMLTAELQEEMQHLSESGEVSRVQARLAALAEDVLRREGYAGVHWRKEEQGGPSQTEDVYRIWDESCLTVTATVRVDANGHKTGVLH